MPYIGDLGVLSKLLALFVGDDEEPIAANEHTIADSVSALHECIDDLEKKVISAREAIAESESELKVCSELEAKLGELRKELDGGDLNSIELRFPEIISEIEQLITELEELSLEEEEEEEEEEDE